MVPVAGLEEGVTRSGSGEAAKRKARPLRCFVIMPFGDRQTDPVRAGELDLLYERARISDKILGRFEWFDDERMAGYTWFKIEAPDLLRVGGGFLRMCPWKCERT